MKGRCTWNKFLNWTTQHWGRSDQFACDTFCSSCEKTRHTGDFPRFHFETVHKLFSITVIPLFSQTYHSGQCHDSTQIESFNLLCSSKAFPLCLFLIPSPPELSCERKSSCLSSDFRLPSLLRLFSQAQIPTLIGESWSQKLVQKWQKEKYPKILTVQFWMQKMSTSADCSTF